MNKNFNCQFYDSMYSDFYALYRFVIIYTFFVSLIFQTFLVLLQLLLTNLQNILKFDVLAMKNEDHKLTKMVLRVVSIHMSRLLCWWHSWHILKSLSIIKQNMTVPGELAGKLDNWTNFTNNCVYLTLVQLSWHSWQSMMYLVKDECANTQYVNISKYDYVNRYLNVKRFCIICQLSDRFSFPKKNLKF